MNFSQMIGKVRVTRIQEMTSAGFTFELMYPLYDKAVIEANRSWMVPNYMTPDTEQMLQSQNSCIVETPETTIFVDPANGNGKVRRIPRFNNLQTPYLDKIRRAGIDLEKVDVVLCTHFHSDHYGWGTRLVDGVYVPTFPNARYLNNVVITWGIKRDNLGFRFCVFEKFCNFIDEYIAGKGAARAPL